MLGTAFMSNYYIMFNYTSGHVGFNGKYYLTQDIIVKPELPSETPAVIPLWAVVIISCCVVGIVLSICICIYFRQKNRALKETLASYDKL